MLTLREIFLYSDQSPLIFSQYLFLFLFTIGFAIFSALQKKITWRNAYLLLFSLFFYYKSGGLYFWLLILSTIVDYYCGSAIHKSNVPLRRKTYLIISVMVNLGLLAFFKYSNYLVEIVNGAFHTQFKAVNFMAFIANGFGANFDIYEIVLPVGISFYTFQTLSYTIDIYRRQLEPAKSIVDFGFFVTFFPQLVAGPIVRASDFLPQIEKRFRITREMLGASIFLIMCGLFKKVVISDYISINYVDRVFDDPQLYTGFSNLMAVYGYSIQIYCDFSGYSDMAIGLAALLGFHLPINFDSPYKATSITDFWRRWHISLSTWLRDYLYISLGGNRKGRIFTYRNLMITMLLGGLWHGAATRFIIWGGLHGLALSIHRLWVQYFPALSNSNKTYHRILAQLVTFHFVAFCWIYFRADSQESIATMLRQITYHFDWSGIWERLVQFRAVFSVIVLGFVIHFLPKRWKDYTRNWYTAVPDYAKAIIFAVVIFICFQAKSADVQPFIYFQF